MKNSHKITDKELSRLCLELSFFLRSGTDAGTGLLLMSEKNETPVLAEGLRKMSEDVLAGVPLSVAGKDSGIFPADAVAMMKIGETTGRSEEVMTTLAEYYRSRDLTANRLRSAVLYPTVLLAVMLGVIFLLLTKVLPVFDDVYATMGGAMTGAAGALLALGQVLRRMLPVIAAVVVLLVGLLFFLWKWGNLKKRLDRTKIAQKYRTARFAKALHMTIASGLSPEEALVTAGELLTAAGEGSEKVEDDRVSASLRLLDQGATFSEALSETELLPAPDCRLLGLALLNGSLEDAAGEIAGELEQDANLALEQLISRIEPALVLTASLLVGGILLCVMVPLTGLMAALG